MTTISVSSQIALRCPASHAEVGQCQLNGPHPGKPHAVRTQIGVVCWNQLETYGWPSHEVPQWVVRLPWAPPADSSAA
jgi:hypothetical protein